MTPRKKNTKYPHIESSEMHVRGINPFLNKITINDVYIMKYGSCKRGYEFLCVVKGEIFHR